jgi:hypothetical protein
MKLVVLINILCPMSAGHYRSKIEHGKSKKVGCQVHFTISQLYCAPTMARIYRQGRISDHIKHGPALAPGTANRFSFQGRFSPELLQWVDKKVRLLGERGSLSVNKLGSNGQVSTSGPDV